MNDAQETANNAPEATAPEAAAQASPAETSQAGTDNLEQLKAKADDLWDRLLRTTANFENFKKRATREKQDAIKYANASLLEKLIPVLDNMDMALNAAKAGDSSAASTQSLQTGITMIVTQFKAALTEVGLQEIDAAGQPFDPNFHEAVSQMESAEVPEGRVLHQLRKGYRLQDRLLRPATVIVAKAPSPTAS